MKRTKTERERMGRREKQGFPGSLHFRQTTSFFRILSMWRRNLFKRGWSGGETMKTKREYHDDQEEGKSFKNEFHAKSRNPGYFAFDVYQMSAHITKKIVCPIKYN